jgi:hypothetical protein
MRLVCVCACSLHFIFALFERGVLRRQRPPDSDRSSCAFPVDLRMIPVTMQQNH